MNLDSLKPRKFLSLGRHDLPHVGDLSKPYFVAIGCSVTVGTGVPYRDSWVDLLGQRLGLEHVNLALDGSSLEYQYHKLLETEKVLTDAKFMLWMQSQPIRSHRMMIRKIIGDKRARIFIDDTLFRTPDVLGRMWRKLYRFYDLTKNKKLIYTNTWNWDPRLLLLLKSKIAKSDKKYFFNDGIVKDKGDDGEHPGSQTHFDFAQKIHTHINTHFPFLTNK